MFTYDRNDSVVNKTGLGMTADGGTGDDKLYGGPAKDDLRGDSGNDRLYRMSETQTGLLRTLIRLEVERVVHQFEPVLEEHANLVAEIRSGDRMRAADAVWTLFRRTSRVLIGAPEPTEETAG